MAVLEKLIKYDQAILEPESELSIVESGAQIEMKPLDRLIYLCHFDGEPGRSGIQFFGKTADALNNLPLTALGCLLLDYDVKKFGTSSILDIGEWGTGLMAGPAPKKAVLAPELTVDFFARFYTLGTSGAERVLAERSLNLSGVSQGWVIFVIDGELGLKLYTTQGTFVLQTSGLNLTANNWYHLRFAWSETLQLAKIFVDGEEAAGDSFSGTVLDSESENYQSPLELLFSTLAQNVWIDEFRIFDSFQSEPFTPPAAPTRPYSQNLPSGRISLDAGSEGVAWVLGSLEFIDETDFDNGGIKLRVDADDDNTPEFTGEPIELSQARGLASMAGRFCHLQFIFCSDGDTQRTLSTGKINFEVLAGAGPKTGYTTVSLVKNELPAEIPGSLTDDIIQRFIHDASRRIDAHLCGCCDVPFPAIEQEPRTPALIERLARRLAVADCLVFLGIANQSELKTAIEDRAIAELDRLRKGELRLPGNNIPVAVYEGRICPDETGGNDVLD